MKFNPVQDRVVVRQVKVETVTTGGIVLSDAAAEKPTEGIVISAGPGRKTKLGVLIPLEVKAGDRVLYYKSAGQAVKVDGEEVLVLKEEEIYAVLEGDGPLT